VASLYVHALADEPTRSWRANGRKIQSVAVGKIFAVGERRARAPELSESELRFQHAVVVHIAGHVPAVLPAQFGALVDDKALDSILRQHESTIREAMTLVRGRVQMTLRTVAPARKSTKGENGGSASGRTAPVSGKQYLQQRRSEASTKLPARLERLVARAAWYVAAERREATRAGTIAVYHLVEKSDVDAYRAALDDLRGVTVSGPWPPFAFVPELWP